MGRKKVFIYRLDRRVRSKSWILEKIIRFIHIDFVFHLKEDTDKYRSDGNDFVKHFVDILSEWFHFSLFVLLRWEKGRKVTGNGKKNHSSSKTRIGSSGMFPERGRNLCVERIYKITILLEKCRGLHGAEVFFGKTLHYSEFFCRSYN